MWRLIIVVALLFVLPACGAPTCAEQAAPFLTQIQSVAQEWDDANKLANNTPRASLPGQISALQAIRRKAQDTEAPACVGEAKTALVAAMDATIEGYIAFLGQKAQVTVDDSFKRAGERMQAFQTALAAIRPTVIP